MADYDGYYFYSKKQKKIRSAIDKHPTFFALIGGKEVECTERSTTPNPTGPFDDYVFLGRGVYIGDKTSLDGGILMQNMTEEQRKSLIEERARLNKRKYGLFNLKVAENELLKEGRI